MAPINKPKFEIYETIVRPYVDDEEHEGNPHKAYTGKVLFRFWSYFHRTWMYVVGYEHDTVVEHESALKKA